MEWSKIKNIIILILVGLNVFLLALVAGILIPTAAYSTYQGVLLIGTMVISIFAVIQLNKIRRN